MSEFTTIEGALEYFKFTCDGVRAEGAIETIETQLSLLREGLEEAWETLDRAYLQLIKDADELKSLRERNEQLHIEKRQALSQAHQWAYKVHALERARDAATGV